jgi:hypothetical protein
VTAVEIVKRDANAHGFVLLAWFLPSLLGSGLSSWLAVWALHQRGWEGQAVGYALALLSTALYGIWLVFGVLLFSWFRDRRYAL